MATPVYFAGLPDVIPALKLSSADSEDSGVVGSLTNNGSEHDSLENPVVGQPVFRMLNSRLLLRVVKLLDEIPGPE